MRYKTFVWCNNMAYMHISTARIQMFNHIPSANKQRKSEKKELNHISFSAVTQFRLPPINLFFFVACANAFFSCHFAFLFLSFCVSCNDLLWPTSFALPLATSSSTWTIATLYSVHFCDDFFQSIDFEIVHSCTPRSWPCEDSNVFLCLDGVRKADRE